MSRACGPVSSGDTAVALLVAHTRYWLTVAPRVRVELRRWYDRAEAIDDPKLRAHAAEKLRNERANTEAIATLCTLAPRRQRPALVVAAVALQVMYDYLDAVTEQDVDDPLRNSRQLFRAFGVALTPGEAPVDYYRHHPQRDDSGYLDALVRSAREALVALPALTIVAPIVRDASQRFTEAQARSHAVPRTGPRQLERWAEEFAADLGLHWWEWAGGAAASILAVHALLALAADSRTTLADASRTDHAYLYGSTLTTMLDSLIDDASDHAGAAHRYIAYYSTLEQTERRVAEIARTASLAARALPHPAHHAMTVVGIAAFYLSASPAQAGAPRAVATCVIGELKPLVVPVLMTLRLWRKTRRFDGMRPRRTATVPEAAKTN